MNLQSYILYILYEKNEFLKKKKKKLKKKKKKKRYYYTYINITISKKITIIKLYLLYFTFVDSILMFSNSLTITALIMIL